MKDRKDKNMDYSKISPYHFFTDDADKKKFNWFAFELASEIEIVVPTKFKKRLSKKGYTQEMFNESCIKYGNQLY